MTINQLPERLFEYNCGPVALKFHEDRTSRVKLLIGPFGTGKTTSAAYDQIMRQSKRVLRGADGVKRSRFAIVRNTFPMLRDTTIKTVLDWFPPLYFGQFNQTEKRYVVRIEKDDKLDREIEILFRALDIDKDVRNLLSLELTGAWVDEAREINETIFQGLLGRVGRYPSMKDFSGKNPFKSPVQVVLTTNYPSREHWLYRDFVKSTIDGYTIYEQGQDENKHNLRPNYYEDLEKDYANRPDLLRTLVRGEWGVTVRGKAVYPEFIRKFHVPNVAVLPYVQRGLANGGTFFGGWDNTGLSPALALAYVNSIGQLMVFKEFCGEDIDIVDFGTNAKIWWESNVPTRHVKIRHIGDPAGKNRDTMKKSPLEYLRTECGIIVEDGIQTFKFRKEAVANLLTRHIRGEPAVIIDPSCVRLIDGFEGGYAYPEIGSSGMFKTEPEKNQYSHIHDGLQYLCSILFGPKKDQHEKPGFNNWNKRPRR